MWNSLPGSSVIGVHPALRVGQLHPVAGGGTAPGAPGAAPGTAGSAGRWQRLCGHVFIFRLRFQELRQIGDVQNADDIFACRDDVVCARVGLHGVDHLARRSAPAGSAGQPIQARATASDRDPGPALRGHGVGRGRGRPGRPAGRRSRRRPARRRAAGLGARGARPRPAGCRRARRTPAGPAGRRSISGRRAADPGRAGSTGRRPATG